ncbi:hybrid sensor histidine kinase/response regulator [Paraburkholderia caballeronis]|uniref:Two-component system, NarL family, sensor histidine kinase UhpB n=1 Tax=Paraburkholderia caballeronis TaxID=416943 RepID=A0A1H7SVW5_9BURK|nr:response regulator [Paraburkholderia caballeronis]PXW25629.1 two-component system sensor histidine kinase UhpB [Paraburkholderia caballeronis]PXX01236.1 two-component system sensor histidine kinase UhpB [Paraburkholderia caballeronis]RAJ99411.1 two-component system sensor histidine kinase UhpB [Paraburkholderia caballeronis]TDV07131.1 two-component system sensor histidine kinase UhpB [Paraburkholderia caballeronis]TDV11275.1 two-component system sensor histidine kinase UhpB [Paraburkholderi
MTKPQIRALLVDDDLVDRIACRRALAADDTYDFVLIEAETGGEGLRLVAEHKPDCVLLDYHLPDQTGLEFLAALANDAGEIAVPVMVLTGGDSAAVAAELMRRGARDYLGKDSDQLYLSQLPAAIQRMLHAQQVLDAKHQAEAKFRTLVEQIQAITYVASADEPGRLQYVSPQIATLGFSADEWLAGDGLHDARVHPDDRERVRAAIAARAASGGPTRVEYRLVARNGDVLWFRDEAQAVLDENGRRLFVQGILVDITQSKLNEDALRQSREALRSLAAHQETIKENERKRIAQEIHDELGSLLTGIKAHVSVSIERATRAGQPPDALLIDAARLADDAIGAVRRVITDLRPSVLDQLGVWEALAWYANQIEMRADLVCECAIDDDASALHLDPDRSTMLFRIVQETLTNVLRHAEASHVSIHAGRDARGLVVEVRDDGKGIELKDDSKRQSWGILGMRERARHFGGELSITGQPGVGTTVVLHLPLERESGGS